MGLGRLDAPRVDREERTASAPVRREPDAVRLPRLLGAGARSPSRGVWHARAVHRVCQGLSSRPHTTHINLYGVAISKLDVGVAAVVEDLAAERSAMAMNISSPRSVSVAAKAPRTAVKGPD